MLGRTLLSLTLIAWIAGCGRWQETAAPAPAKPWKQEPEAGTTLSQQAESAKEAHQSANGDQPEESEDQPAESIDSPQAEPSELPGQTTYNTGDCDDWPSYELPLAVEIEILELPEEITRRAEPLPDEEE